MKKFIISLFVIIFCLASARYYYHLEAEKKLLEITQYLSSWVFVSYEDVDVSLSGAITLHSLSVHNHHKKLLFQTKELEIEDYKISNNQVVKLSLNIKNLNFKTYPSAAGEFGFYELGYQEITSNLHLAYNYTEFSNRLLIDLQAHFEQMAKLNLLLEIANFDIAQFQYYLRDPRALLFLKGEVKYTDLDLVKNLLAFIKKQKNMSEQQFLEIVDKEFKPQGNVSDERQKLIEQWKEFILKPNNIALTSSVSDGYSIRQMLQITDKMQLFKALNTTIVVNQ